MSRTMYGSDPPSIGLRNDPVARETSRHEAMDKEQDQNSGDQVQIDQSGQRQLDKRQNLQSWLQVFAVFIIWTNSWGLSNSFGVFQTYYESDQGFPSKTPSEISWIGSVQPFLLLFVGVLSGPLYDAGYLHTLVVVGTVLVVFGMMMTSICTEFWQALLAQGITCGIGYGLLFTPGVSIIPQYFVKHRVLASGLASAGSGFGGLVYPIVFRRLQPQIGFGWTVRVIGFLTLFLGILSIAIVRSQTKSGCVRQLFSHRALTELPFFFNTLGLFFALTGLYIPFYYVGTYSLRIAHTGPDLAFYLVPIMNAGSIAGRVLPNFLADTTGSFNMLVPCTAIAGVLCFVWIGISNAAGLIVFAILYGFFSGTFLSLPPTVVAALTSDKGVLGTRTGTCFATASFGVLIGTPICGAILNGTGSFVGLQVFGGCCILAAAVSVAMARVAKAGLKVVKI